MKNRIAIFQITLLLFVLSSCGSTKEIQKEVNRIKTNLFYELTSQEYLNSKSDTMYLEFIDYSNLNYYTAVKKKNQIIVPLIVYNYQGSNYTVSLGENSLSQTYREFLTEALLTECNSSTAIALFNEQADTSHRDSYRLTLKVIKNTTHSGIKLKNNSVIWFEGDYLEFINHSNKDAITNLAINVKLKKGDNCYLDKTYETIYCQPKPQYHTSTIIDASERCIDLMAESLSQATKELVENICQELSLIIANQKPTPISFNQ